MRDQPAFGYVGLIIAAAALVAGCGPAKPAASTETPPEDVVATAPAVPAPPGAGSLPLVVPAAAGTPGSLLRPAGYYSLMFADPSQIELCRQFHAAMSEAFRAPPFDPAKTYGPSDNDALNEVSMLLMGSRTTIEPWQRRILKQNSGAVFMGFRAVDLNHDGAVDRVYRSELFVGNLSPNGELRYHNVYLHFGKADEPTIADETEFGQVADDVAYTMFDPSTARAASPAFSAPWRNFYSYSMFLENGEAWLIASSPDYPEASLSEVYLFRFEGDRPQVACYLTGTFIVPNKFGVHPEDAFSETPPSRN